MDTKASLLNSSTSNLVQQKKNSKVMIFGCFPKPVIFSLFATVFVTVKLSQFLYSPTLTYIHCPLVVKVA